MDQSINVIAALLNVLKSDNVEFTGLNAQGTVNVANILAQADAFVQNAVEEAKAAQEEEASDNE